MSNVAVDARMLGVAGIGTYLRNLLPRLIGSDPAARFHLLGDPAELEAMPWARSPGVAPVACRAPIYSLSEQLELWRKTPRHTDLFWSPHYNLPVLHRGRLVVTVHDVLHLAMPQFVGGAHRRLYARAMFALVRRKADAILCDSHFTAAELVRLAGVDSRRIHVVHLGVDEAWFGEAGPRPYPRPYLLFVGNVKPHKNLVTLVAALASLATEIPHDLVVVGRREGFLTGDRRVAEATARLGERVHFTGELAAAGVRAYVAHADALMLPSLYEGFGLPPLEAMAAGCPVIVSRAASLPEVCGDAAIYFEPRDPTDLARQILRLLDDGPLRVEMIDRGRRHAQRFRWERCARETWDVFQEVLRTG